MQLKSLKKETVINFRPILPSCCVFSPLVHIHVLQNSSTHWCGRTDEYMKNEQRRINYKCTSSIMNSILFTSGKVVLLLPLLKVSLNNSFWQPIIYGSHQNPSGKVIDTIVQNYHTRLDKRNSNNTKYQSKIQYAEFKRHRQLIYIWVNLWQKYQYKFL